MDPNPYQAFRRAAASALARMSAALVEEALSLPAALADRTGRAVGARVISEVQRRTAAIKMLIDLPHHLADMLADSWRGPDARALTAREHLAISDGFGARAHSDLIRIVPGPGLSAIAAKAFENGNPAITLGNTIYLNPAAKWPVYDLTTGRDGESLALLMHEVMHVIQYRELGYARFLRRYGMDMATVKGDANEMYRYAKRNRSFKDEMIEGQAEMVGDYTTLRATKDPKLQPRRDDVRRRLKGSRFHGL